LWRGDLRGEEERREGGMNVKEKGGEGRGRKERGGRKGGGEREEEKGREKGGGRHREGRGSREQSHKGSQWHSAEEVGEGYDKAPSRLELFIHSIIMLDSCILRTAATNAGRRG